MLPAHRIAPTGPPPSTQPDQAPRTAVFTTVIAFLQCGGAGSLITPLCKAFEAVCAAHGDLGSKFDYLVQSGTKLLNRHWAGRPH